MKKTKEKILKKTLVGFVAVNVLATTVITGLPVQSWAEELAHKEQQSSESKKSVKEELDVKEVPNDSTQGKETAGIKSKTTKAVKAATYQNVKIKFKVVDVRTGKPLQGYRVRFLEPNGSTVLLHDFPASDANGLAEGDFAAISKMLNEGKSIELYVKWDPAGNSVTPNLVTEVKPSDVKNNEITTTVYLGKAVQAADLGNQQWLIDMAEHYTGKKVGKDMSFPDLEKITTLKTYDGFTVKDANPVLPAAIKYFPNLTSLNLSSVGLKGEVPKEIGALKKLEFLNLAYNGFTGQIPSEISQLSNLKSLYLGVNNFSGTIPASFSNLKSVSDMDLSSISGLTGTIDGLADMTGLTRLRLENTKLVGQIPDGLFHLDFGDLDFRNTELTVNQAGIKKLDNGKTPKYTNSFVAERTLVATKNPVVLSDTTVEPFKDFGLKADINGTKSDLFAGHTYRIYRESDNKQVYYGKWNDSAAFEQTGVKETYRIVLDDASENPNNIAKVTVNAAKNQVVKFSDLNNQYWLKDLAEHYTGKIVDENMTFGDLEKITTLKTYSGFTVKDTNPVLPPAIKYFPNLTTLNVSRFGLKGEVPTEIEALKKLEFLDLAYNDFTGKIPSEIGQLSDLKTLYLGVNNFSSTIPASFSNLKKVSDMDLSSISGLTGTIDGLADMTGLTRLRLENTKLVGQIPDGLFHLDFSDLDFRDTELTVNQADAKKLDNGETPKYTNSFVAERTLVATENPVVLSNTTVAPFKDFGLKADIKGTKSDLFAGHTYDIYRTSDNKKVYSGPWDDNATFEQTGKEEGYQIVLDGASKNPHNVATVQVNQKKEAIGTIQVVVKDEQGNPIPGVTVAWKDINGNFGRNRLTEADGSFVQSNMGLEREYQYTVQDVPEGYINTGDSVKVTPGGKDGSTYTVTLQVLKDITINPMTELDDTVTGTAPAGVKLRYFVDGQAVNIGNATADGTYSKVVGLHKAGTVIGVQMQDPKTGKYRELKTITVTPVATKLTVNEMTTNDDSVTGTAPKGVKLRFLIDGKAVNVGYADADGKFNKVIGKQKAGTIVGVQMFDPALGNYSDVVTTTVKAVAAPVKVNAMTTSDTAVSGTAPAGSKLRIVVNGQAVNIAYADADGKFNKVIGMQKEGAIIGVELFNSNAGAYEDAVTVKVTGDTNLDTPAKINPISAKEGIVSGSVPTTISQVRVWVNNVAQTVVAAKDGQFTWKKAGLKEGDTVKVDYKNAAGKWIAAEATVVK